MKMVKSLLLGTATALVAVSGAAAADLPVKAKPVQYVKICSLYGNGYFYIPGTDTCIKLGGAVRVQYEGNAAAGVPIGFNSAANAVYNRAAYSPIAQRTRIYFSFDTRQQTEYGTLRTYARFGMQQTTPADAPGGTFFWDRAFIQFAGFTFGKTVSYYDAFGTGDLMYSTTRYGDTAATGVTVVAYTAQFGGGLSASISLEDPNVRGRTITDGGAVLGGFPGTDVGFAAAGNGYRYPDLIANLRIDQAWGSAQINGAIRDVAYNGGAGILAAGVDGSEVGYAVGAGININLPGWGAVGNANGQPNVDQFRLGFNYCEGATGFCGPSTANNGAFLISQGGAGFGTFGSTSTVGYGFDAVVTPAGNLDLTTAWSAFAAFQHLWTPTLRTSVYGAYLSYNYSDAASAALVAAPAGVTGSADTNIWQIGSRTQWNPVSQLDLGVDFLYSAIDSDFSGVTPAGGVIDSTDGTFSVHLRAQRNFWP